VDEPQRSADQAQTRDEPVRQSFVQDFSFMLTRDFTVRSVDCREQQTKALNGDPTFTVMQSQLMEIARRACHDVPATSFSNSLVRSKQLSYGSPHDEVETNLQPPAVGREESGVRGRSTTARHSTELPPTRTHVQWKSPSTDDDEIFDARQSLSRSVSRSRTSVSRDHRSTSSSPPAGQRPPNPSDDCGDNKDGKNRRSPSPPPIRSESTVCPQP